VVILLYHRVTELPIDPQLLCVSSDHFAEHLEVLRRHFNPLSLRQLVEFVAAGKLPARAVVVTFDDGYADNLTNAKSLLNRYDVPATVFVATGTLGGDREFWWDEVERLLLHGRRLPASLRLNANGINFNWELGQAAEPMDGWIERHRGWNVGAAATPGTGRAQLYSSLCRRLRPLSYEQREAALDALRDWAGSDATGRSTHRALSPDEVVELAEGDQVEIGAHTVTHPVLSALTVSQQREEVTRSKARLEEILGHRVTSFSYPYGTANDYTPATVDVVKSSGFNCACSNFAHSIDRGTSRFELPRVLVRDWDGETLARRVREAFDG
jgi:peptidoglycan/xylan/chitin deacetylase (PgdA/CDA1 family)